MQLAVKCGQGDPLTLTHFKDGPPSCPWFVYYNRASDKSFYYQLNRMDLDPLRLESDLRMLSSIVKFASVDVLCLPEVSYKGREESVNTILNTPTTDLEGLDCKEFCFFDEMGKTVFGSFVSKHYSDPSAMTLPEFALSPSVQLVKELKQHVAPELSRKILNQFRYIEYQQLRSGKRHKQPQNVLVTMRRVNEMIEGALGRVYFYQLARKINPALAPTVTFHPECIHLCRSVAQQLRQLCPECEFDFLSESHIDGIVRPFVQSFWLTSISMFDENKRLLSVENEHIEKQLVLWCIDSSFQDGSLLTAFSQVNQLSFSKLTLPHLKFLKFFPQLIFLKFKNCSLQSLEGIEFCQRLRHLVLANPTLTSVDEIEHVTDACSVLTLDGSHVCSLFFECSRKILTKLTELYIPLEFVKYYKDLFSSERLVFLKLCNDLGKISLAVTRINYMAPFSGPHSGPGALQEFRRKIPNAAAMICYNPGMDQHVHYLLVSQLCQSEDLDVVYGDKCTPAETLKKTAIKNVGLQLARLQVLDVFPLKVLYLPLHGYVEVVSELLSWLKKFNTWREIRFYNLEGEVVHNIVKK